MRDGKVVQIDTPDHVYARPANLFSAEFIGSPPMNLLRGQVCEVNDTLLFVCSDSSVPNITIADSLGVSCELFGQCKEIVLGVRPEHLDIASPGAATAASAVVTLRQRTGPEVILYLRTNGSKLIARIHPGSQFKAGDTVSVNFPNENLHFFDAETGNAIWSPKQEDRP